MEDKKYKIEDENHKGEVIVSWIITHGCQERCAYCISPNKTKEITDKETHMAIQEQMIKTGLNKNRYIGGEPLIIPHLPELMEASHNCGVNNRLSTNGILLDLEMWNKIKKYINSIAFPFESTNDSLNEKIRGSKQHRELISNRIKMIKDTSDIGVLVNTCVHKENIQELELLGELLLYLGVDHWKLRKFSGASGRGAIINRNRFNISDDEFNKIVLYLKNRYPNLRIDGRMPKKLETRLMLSPQGELYRMVGSEDNHIKYGNILTRKLNIKEIYEKDHCN